jgi:hypothetical protein
VRAQQPAMPVIGFHTTSWGERRISGPSGRLLTQQRHLVWMFLARIIASQSIVDQRGPMAERSKVKVRKAAKAGEDHIKIVSKA